VPSPKLVDMQNLGECSHNSADCDARAQSSRARGGKGIWGSGNKLAGTFFRSSGLGLGLGMGLPVQSSSQV
jgi:hypothetical protein